MKYTIHITQKHIDDKLWGDVWDNPISLAIEEVFGAQCAARVVTGTLGIVNGWKILLPASVRALVNVCDEENFIPCSFELNIPDDVDGVVRIC